MRMTNRTQHVPALLILSTVLLLSGCPFWDTGSCEVNYPTSQPTTESRQVKVTEFTQAPSTMGKIYLYQQYLFINAPYQGIYIYDNSDATQPIPLIFIEISGNVDMAIKEGYLYVDSYGALVTIKLVDDFGNVLIDANNIAEVSRVEKVFPNYSIDYGGLGNDSC